MNTGQRFVTNRNFPVPFDVEAAKAKGLRTVEAWAPSQPCLALAFALLGASFFTSRPVAMAAVAGALWLRGRLSEEVARL